MTAFRPITPERRIALLIDGDNVSAEQVCRTVEMLLPEGELRIRRAYGNWEAPSSVAAELQAEAIQAFCQRSSIATPQKTSFPSRSGA